MPSIPLVSATDSTAKVVACLERDGAVVVTGVIDSAVRDSILRELAPHLEIVDPDASINKKYEADGGTANFYPGKTKRITALVARSETFRTFVTHPLMLSACDAILKPNCVHYQVHATAALAAHRSGREDLADRGSWRARVRDFCLPPDAPRTRPPRCRAGEVPADVVRAHLGQVVEALREETPTPVVETGVTDPI